MSYAADQTEVFQRNLLTEMLNQCTEKQQDFFREIFPNGVPVKKLVDAINLCQRTIDSNQKAALDGKE